MAWREKAMHRAHQFLIALRARDRQDLGKAFADVGGAGPQAAGHDHAPVFRQGLIDGAQRLIDRGLDKPTGVDDHEVGVFIARRDLIALGPELGQDAFRVHQGLGTAQAHEADARVGFRPRGVFGDGRTGHMRKPPCLRRCR